VRHLGLAGTPRALRIEGPIRVLLVVAAPTEWCVWTLRTRWP
jgi:hypothetical protein